MPKRYFDRYVIVDWSAAAAPKTGKDSIWIAELSGGRSKWEFVKFQNPPTRRLASSILESIFTSNEDQRILVGFDFPLGFPAGTTQALVGTRSKHAWLRIWKELAESITDDEENQNNRFTVASHLNRRMSGAPGPFWGCNSGFRNSRLLPTRPQFPFAVENGNLLREFRISEEFLRGHKKRVQSVWKLFTEGSVGSQTLTGIPILQSLRKHRQLQERIRVWPFENGFELPEHSDAIVFTEVWPTILGAASKDSHLVKDAAQLLTYIMFISELDRKGKLEKYFGAPEGARPEELETAVREEGWILGARR